MSASQDRCRLCPTTSLSVDSKMVMCFDANPSTSQAVYLTKAGTNSVADVLNQHFGFKLNPEYDAMAFVCKPCWRKVDEFHQFYQSVLVMYETERSSDPLNVDHKCDIPLLDTAPGCGNEAVELEKAATVAEAEDDYDDYCDNGDNHYDNADDDFLDGDSWGDDFDEELDYDDDDDDDENSNGIADDFADNVVNNDNEPGPVKAEPTPEMPPPVSAAVTDNDFVDDDDFCWPDDDEVDETADKVPEDAAASNKSILEEDELIRKHIPMHCHLCSKPYETEADAHRHHMAEHNQKGFLLCCDRKFYNRTKLLKHCKYHQSLINQPRTGVVNRGRTSYCTECFQIFPSVGALKQHCTEAHGSFQSKFQCVDCGKWYKTAAIMMRHKNTHRDEQWVCEECGHIAQTKSKLSGHRFRVHRGGKKRRCPECGLMLKSPNDLRDHISSLHEGRLRHQCPNCTRTFATNKKLYYHRTKYHVEAISAARRELVERSAAEAERNKAEHEAAVARIIGKPKTK